MRLKVKSAVAGLAAVAFFGAAALTSEARAADGTVAAEDEVRVFMETLVSESIRLLSDGSVSAEQREDSFRALLTENFDINAIVGFVLARHWRVATDEQRDEFREIFVRATTQRFVPIFEGYDGAGLRVSGVRVDSKQPRIAEAVMLIPYRDGGTVAKTSWRVYHEEDGVYKILDAKVEGVSMILSLRQEYSGIISRDGLDGLLTQLREKYPEG